MLARPEQLTGLPDEDPVAVISENARLREVLCEQVSNLGLLCSGFPTTGTVSRRLGRSQDGCFWIRGWSSAPGEQVIPRLCASGRLVVALTRLRSSSDCDRARHAGAHACLPKPLLQADLARLLAGPAQRAAYRAEGAQRAECAFQRTRSAGRRPSGQPRDRGGDVALAGMYGGDRRQRHCRGQDLYQRQLRRGPDGYPDA